MPSFGHAAGNAAIAVRPLTAVAKGGINATFETQQIGNTPPSRFSISTPSFRESAIGNRFWKNGLTGGREVCPDVSIYLRFLEGWRRSSTTV